MENEYARKNSFIKYYYNNIFNDPYEIINDPINKLFFNYNEIDNILQLKEPKIIKFLYFNKFTIHTILYKEEEIINIDVNINNNENNLNVYFYLLLLIMDNNINYSFSTDFIKKINQEIIRNNNEIFKKLIDAKIIIGLINYYLEENEESDELNKIKKYNMQIIKNNISIFKDIDLEWKEEEFIKKNIDDIYINIIEKILFKKNKFEDYNYTDSIINQLDLLKIDLTKKMFNKLKNIFNNNKEYIKKYIILRKEDLFDENKINYYYILLRYILKNSFYIYQIHFLFETKKFLINCKKDDTNKISNLFKINDKIETIITNITESQFYYNIFKNQNQITKSNTSYFNDTNEQINFISSNFESVLNKDFESDFIYNNESIYKILKDSSITLNINKFGAKISYDKIMYGEYGNGTIYKKFKKPFKKGENQNFKNEFYNSLFLNYKKFLGFLKIIKKEMKKKDFHNLKLLIKLEIKTIQKKNVNDLYDNISCKYILNNPILIDINKNVYEDENILNNNNYEKFNLFIDDIINIIYNNTNEENRQNLPIFSSISSVKIKSNKSLSTKYFIKEKNIEFKNYKIIGFKAVIETDNMPVKYLKALNNDNLIIAAIDDKLLLYDIIYNKNIIKYLNFHNISFYELENKGIIFYSNNNILCYPSLNKENGIFKTIEKDIKNITQTTNQNFIICSSDDISLMSNLTSKIVQLGLTEIYKKSYIGAIHINDNYSALTSNKVLSNGEDKMIIYSFKAKTFIEIKEYSFILSKNNLSLIPIPDKYNETKNDKLLLCACKKYLKSQKNGILLLKLNISDNNINIYKTFYNTGNFEVYCFCNISNFNSSINIILGNEKINEKINPEYIFVGGYDNYKKKGLIKLYEIIYNENIQKIKLEYIQDIQIDKIIKKEYSKEFKGYKGPIYFIEQFIANEDILISSFDKNICLFCPPYL